jgi:hypothetical protein
MKKTTVPLLILCSLMIGCASGQKLGTTPRGSHDRRKAKDVSGFIALVECLVQPFNRQYN